MSRGVIFDDVTDTSGNALPGISVTIFEEGTTTKATLYDARVGGNNLDNPLTTNDRGIFLAYLEPGSYDISVAAPTGTFVKPGVPALDPDDVNDLNDNIADINAALDLLDDTGALNALQTVDTLAELKASTLPSGSSVRCLGRTAVGDGYAGPFWITSDDYSAEVSADPDSGVYVALDNGNYAVRQYGQAIDSAAQVKPAWFDGSITSAGRMLNALFGGGTVKLGTGTFEFSTTQTIYSGVQYIGDGTRATFIKQADGANLGALLQIDNFANLKDSNTWYANAADDPGGATYDCPTSFAIRDIYVDGNAANQTAGDGVGIRLYGKKYDIQNVVIADTRGTAFYSEAGNKTGQQSPFDLPESTINNLYTYRAGGYGIQFRGPHDAIFGNALVSTSTLNGCQFEESANYLGACDIGYIHSYGNSGNGFAINTAVFAKYLQPESNVGKGLVATKTVVCDKFRAFKNQDVALNITSNRCSFGDLIITDNFGNGAVSVGGSNNVFDNLAVDGFNSAGTGIFDNGASNSFKGRVINYDAAGGRAYSNGGSPSRSIIDLRIANCDFGYVNNSGAGYSDITLLFDLSAGQTAILENTAIPKNAKLSVNGTVNGVDISESYTGLANVDMSLTTSQLVTVNHNMFKTPTIEGIQISHYATIAQEAAGYTIERLSVVQATATTISVRFKLSATAATGNGSVIIHASVP